MKSKDCKNKHDHKLTNILKATLFSIVMLAPILAIATTCLYAIFNENARDSFSGTISYKETANISSMNEIISNRNYYSLEYLPRPAISTIYNITTLIIVDENNNIIFNSENYNYSYFCIYTDAYFQIEGQETQYVDQTPQLSGRLIRISNQNVNITTMLLNSPKYTGNTNWLTSGKILFDVYYINTELNDAFYYGVESMEKADIFNWSKNTIIYTGINNMNTQLGVGTEALSILMAYWTIITAIYIVIDIVIETFTYLTHWFNDKMV